MELAPGGPLPSLSRPPCRWGLWAIGATGASGGEGCQVGHQARGWPLSAGAACPVSPSSNYTADSLAGTRGAAWRWTMLMGEAQPLGPGTGNLEANAQERMIRADFIPAPSRNRPIMSGKSCKADQKEVEALEMACCTADPCLGGV
jgi:hypothetical protein